MKALLVLTLSLGLLVPVSSASAKGCLTGAADGAVAGHPGAAGAAAGCVIGHHEAEKKQKAQTSNGSATQK